MLPDPAETITSGYAAFDKSDHGAAGTHAALDDAGADTPLTDLHGQAAQNGPPDIPPGQAKHDDANLPDSSFEAPFDVASTTGDHFLFADAHGNPHVEPPGQTAEHGRSDSPTTIATIDADGALPVGPALDATPKDYRVAVLR